MTRLYTIFDHSKNSRPLVSFLRNEGKISKHILFKPGTGKTLKEVKEEIGDINSLINGETILNDFKSHLKYFNFDSEVYEVPCDWRARARETHAARSSGSAATSFDSAHSRSASSRAATAQSAAAPAVHRWLDGVPPAKALSTARRQSLFRFLPQRPS